MENQTKNVILVASDFTSIGDYAVENAANVAKLLNFRVVVFHVINKETKESLKKENQSLDLINDKLEKITSRIKSEYGIEASHVAREGSIFTTIAELAEELGAEYLFIGTHGKKGIQFFLGSFILKVIKSSPVPVFVVQKPFEKTSFKNIIFPLDLEMGSKQKIKWAVTLAQQFNATIHFFILNQNDEYNHNKIRADFNQIKKILEKNNISFTEKTSSSKNGSFVKQTISYAKELNADLIMLSTDPEKITWSLFGSSDEHIIYNIAKIPTLCINVRDLKIILGGL